MKPTSTLIAATALALLACGPDESAVPAAPAQSTAQLLGTRPAVPPRTGEGIEILPPVVVVPTPGQAMFDARLNAPTPEQSFFYDVPVFAPCAGPGPGAPLPLH